MEKSEVTKPVSSTPNASTTNTIMPMVDADAMERASSELSSELGASARAPKRPATVITSDRPSAKQSASWPNSPSMLLAFFPAALALQRRHQFGRHVFLVMLGQHFAGIE